MHALLVHGAGGGAWEWNVWQRVFAAHGTTPVAMDLRPHPAGLAATRWSDYLDQVERAVLALPAPRVLVGASLGGLLAMAATARVDVHAMVLVNPLPPSPEAALLPRRSYRPIVAWRRDASLSGTRRALPDADDASCVYAFRRWRDDSGAVLNEARAGIELAPPRCPVLILASRHDDDVPLVVARTLAQRIGASLHELDDSHVGPLLGRHAAPRAREAVRWLSAR